MKTLPLLLASLFVAAGCHPKADASPPAEPAVDDGSSPDKDPEQSDVHISKKLADLCNITTPEFGYNSTKLTKQARATLDALAACFIDGPAAEENMSLVGHADPRGSEEYNFGLGQKRAGSVEKYLTKRGLGEGRIESSSRGELDAVGTDAKSWARDRRVEIDLAER